MPAPSFSKGPYGQRLLPTIWHLSPAINTVHMEQQ
jgi:hypothetical protein